jgi:DNA-binding response OmpR family regulator
MKRAKALIVDLYSASPLGRDLQRILESSPNLAMTLQAESLKPDQSPPSESTLSGTIRQFNSDLIFFVLSSNRLKLTAELVQLLRRQKTMAPVVAIFENGKPGEMVQLLKAGIDDFY